MLQELLIHHQILYLSVFMAVIRTPHVEEHQYRTKLIQSEFPVYIYVWPDLLPNTRTAKSAPGGAWRSAGPRWGAREGAWEGARDLFLVLGKGGRAPSQAPSQAPSRAPSQAPSRAASQAPHLGPALPQAPPGALLGVRAFGTSVAGQATRKSTSVSEKNQFWIHVNLSVFISDWIGSHK